MMTSWGFLFTNLTVAISYIKKMEPQKFEEEGDPVRESL
jgi:hypothetical protein